MTEKLGHKNISVQEKIREKFILEKNFSEFKKTYRSNLGNLNTGKFWNQKFNKQQLIDDQDGMTKEKISYMSDILEKLPQPINLFDIGIGQAYLEQDLTKRRIKFNLFSVDISELSVRRAKKKYEGKGFVDDALNMDKYYKEKTFDVVVAVEVIEHISPDKIFSFYKKVHNLLKDDGLFIISTPLNEGLSKMKDNPSAHVREYTIPILEAEFHLSNFQIVKTKTFIAFKNFYYIKKILSRIFTHHWKPNNIVIVAKKG